jgi:hypothetical protein
MKTLLFITTFIICTCSIFAQNKRCFTYDENGNRTSRIICFKNPLTKSDTSLKKHSLYDNLGKMKITLSPNPTKGQLIIEVINLPENAKGSITIADASGKILQELSSLKSTNTLDLSSQSSGMYFLRIRAGDEVSQWKVLKE